MNIKITTANEPENNSKESKKNPATEYSKEAYEKALKIAGERAENQRLEIKALKEKIEDLQTILRNQTEQNDSLKQRYEAACVANLELQKEVIKQSAKAELSPDGEDPCSDCEDREYCYQDKDADEFEIEEEISLEELPELTVAELSGEIEALHYCIHALLSWVFDKEDS